MRTNNMRLLKVVLTIGMCASFSTSLAQEMFFAVNDNGTNEVGIQGSESHLVDMNCDPPLGKIGGLARASVGDFASSGQLGSDAVAYSVFSFDTLPMAVGNFTLKLSEVSFSGNAFGDLGKVIVEYITSDVKYPDRFNPNSPVDQAGYATIGYLSHEELFDPDGIDISNAFNSVLNQESHPQYIYIRIRFEVCQNGNNMDDLVRIAKQGDAGRAHVLGTASGVLPVDGSLAGSWYLPERNGEGAVIDIWDYDGSRVVALYFYTYRNDASGNQLYVVGGDAIVGNEVTLTMFETSGPTFGPGYDRDDLVEDEWGTVILTFISCGSIQLQYDSPEYGKGTLSMVRFSNPIQGVIGVCNS